MVKPRCPHCERPAPIRIESATPGYLHQTVQCIGCRNIYRIKIHSEAGRLQVQSEAL